MPTRKDNTNVAPIYREQVFIPASGATLMIQEARPKVGGRPINDKPIEIVSPEFDLLTGIRGIANLPKGFLKTSKLPQGENLYYRQLDKNSRGLERAKRVGVIDTQSSGGVDFVHEGRTLRLGKTFNTPFFSKGSLWYNNVDDMDVIVGKDNPLLDWKMINQHGGVTSNAKKAGSRRTPFYNDEVNQAPTELFELYRRYPGIGYRNVTNGFPTMPITGLNTAAEQMKCGGRRKAQLGLDIREGGIAIPIAPNMYYMNGRSHDEGGIGIGPNNKNGLEVEGGEVVKVGDRDIKVFSSVPLLRGVSPAQLVMGGANPNKVFAAQENFKDRNRINDDGTRYEIGGEKEVGGGAAIGRVLSRIMPKGKLPYAYTINNLYSVENPKRKGIKGNTAKMYDNRTLGAGVDVVSGHPELYKKAKAGKITKKQADETAVIHLRKDDDAIRNNYADVYGKAAADTLSYGPRFLVAQARYQQGNVRKAWPAIHKAMAKGDAKALKKAVLQVTPKDHTYRRDWVKDFKVYKAGGIHIKPSKRGTFTAAAKKHGMSVQGFASKVLANKEDYSPAMVKKANFARNVKRWKKEFGGDDRYYSTMEKVAEDNYKQWGFNNADEALIHALNDNTYNYKGYYDKYPNSSANADTHWTDEFKTVYHPTFSIESKYSGKKSDYNPLGLIGGYWNGDNFVPAEWQKNKKKFGGNMIYTINGNVKNGLMSTRPKAEWGKGKSEKKWKYPTDDKSVVRGYFENTPYGNIYDDGDSSLLVNGEEIFKMNPIFIEEAMKYQTNKRPQYYAEKRLPVAGNQSIAEKAGLARSGWSYGDSPSLDYMPNINLTIPENYGKGVAGSTPRGRGTKATTSKATTQSTKKDTNVKYGTPLAENRVNLYNTAIKHGATTPTKAAKEKITSPTGGGTQPTDGRWVGQYNVTNTGDWIGLGANLLGSIGSYFMTKNAINKTPMPVKPVMAPSTKLKTRYNIEPQLTEIRESEQMNRAAVRRNTQSSNTSLAREQRLLNEARGARNQLYGQKENIETQLINQDKLNRQSVARDNVKAYNDYLNRVTATKQGQSQMRISNINNLIAGLTGGVNSILSNIDSRRTTNNTLRAIAAANPNVDARLIGGFDYYIDPVTKRRYNKYQQYVGNING